MPEKPNYHYPSFANLTIPPYSENSPEEDRLRSRDLEEALSLFPVKTRLVHMDRGPAFTRFELEPEEILSPDRIIPLEKDIARRMSVASVRMIVPDPGVRLVFIEVPNQRISTVTLREILESDRMQSKKSRLAVAMGKNTYGDPVISDFASGLSMLLLGQTGSGKTTLIHSIINSLLYRAGPDDVKLILIDPKMIDLQRYNGLPHLLFPVIHDPRKALDILEWAFRETTARWDRFMKKRIHNIDEYNELAGKDGRKPMPRIVIVIDELADLLLTDKEETGTGICRLSFLAHSAGIHLVMATQLPYGDLLPWAQDAKIPIHIVFRTEDKSLAPGFSDAEKLLGWGDMLIASSPTSIPTRIQGCFVSEVEIDRTVKDVCESNPGPYDPGIIEDPEKNPEKDTSDEPKPDTNNDNPDKASRLRTLNKLMQEINQLIDELERSESEQDET